MLKNLFKNQNLFKKASKRIVSETNGHQVNGVYHNNEGNQVHVDEMLMTYCHFSRKGSLWLKSEF